MNWFDNLRLRGKLFVNFLVSGGVLVAAIIFCLMEIRVVGQNTDDIAKNWLPSVQAAGEISQLRLRYRVRSLEYMLPGSEEEKQTIEKSLHALDSDISAALKNYEPLISSNTERTTYEQAVKGVAAYRATVLEAIALVKTGKESEAQQLRKTTWVKAANYLRDQTDALQKLNREGSEQSAAQAAIEVRSAVTGGIAALFIGIILALACSLMIAQRISSRLNHAVIAAREIAKGDLTVALPPATSDEVGTLLDSMSNMQSALRNAMRETTGSAESILGAAQNLNEAVNQMNQSASIQSSAASAIAASVEELTVSINIVADNTGQAAQVAKNSDAQANEGHRAIETLVAQIAEVANVVRESATQMNQLQSDSEKISTIVAVIKDIADQTNLLALNAAIEAARAGEAGRGFAVVADEVRKLSERTALSTSEISKMVGTIQGSTEHAVSCVSHGVELVDSSVAIAGQAGDVIARMREMAQQVASLVGEVDGALREQSSASTEVAQKIEDIATQAEEANSIANETSQASDSMAQTAQSMQALVSRFKV